jgi:hypothetical protein
MANQVTYTNLFSEARNNVIALLTFANVPDPLSTAYEYRKWIYSREPDVKASDFSGYPYLVVNSSNVDINPNKGSLNMKSKEVSWDIEIEIVTSDRGYGANDGKGLTNMDSISDAIVKTFMNKTNRITLSNNSMKFTNPTTTAVGTEIIDNELVYRRSILFGFKSRIQISA